MTLPAAVSGRRLQENIAIRQLNNTITINTWDLTLDNENSDVTRTNANFSSSLVKLKRVYEKNCLLCTGNSNINTLKYLYMGANIVPYNHSNLNDDGMTAISIFNNDFGYKNFSYKTDKIKF
jgi:hypothetical protein